MIQTKGYKAFKGILKIREGEITIVIRGDWVYDPNDKMWHNEYGSFCGDFCEVIKDEQVLTIKKRGRK